MKYIRTKDGRIIDTNTYLDKCFVKEQQGGECKWEKFGNGCCNCRFNELRKIEIINQADTIEELCDEFVVFDNNGKPQVYSPFNLKVWTTNNDLYGAIWTDKGLIYVAKMSKKGELELLW